MTKHVNKEQIGKVASCPIAVNKTNEKQVVVNSMINLIVN